MSPPRSAVHDLQRPAGAGHADAKAVDILIVSRCLPWPLHDGDRLIVHHLAAELGQRGHACDVVAFSRLEETRETLARSRAICRDLEVITERPRSPARYLARLAQPFPRSVRKAWNPDMWRAIERRVESRRYDLALLFGGVQVYEFRELVSRLPTVIVPYESYSLFLERAIADAGGPLERLRIRPALAAARRYERVIYRGYDRVVVLTDRDRKTLLRLSPDLPVIVIPNGVHASHMPRGRVEPPTLVFVGNFDHVPNVRAATILALEVLPRVRRRRPDARAVIVGVNPPAAISALAGEAVDVTGGVPDVAPYLARAACFVAPITRGAGMKNKILESMAAGLPVVTTPMGCDGLAVVDGTHLMLGSNALELAEAALRLLEDNALAERVGAEARRFVEAHHTWAHVAARYEALCTETITDPSRRISTSTSRAGLPRRS